MSQTWKIKNLEYEVDMGDVEFAERFETAVNNMDESDKACDKTGKASVILKKQCQIVHNFFDDVFGEGTSKEIFEGKYNYKDCVNAYYSLLDCADESTQELLEAQNNVKSKRNKRRKAQKKMYN